MFDLRGMIPLLCCNLAVRRCLGEYFCTNFAHGAHTLLGSLLFDVSETNVFRAFSLEWKPPRYVPFFLDKFLPTREY